MLAEGLFNLMTITPSITALVGGSIHHGSLRKGYTLPAIRMSAVTSTPIVTNSGTSDLLFQRWQFDAFASNYLDSHRLRDAIRALLDDYSGTLAEGTVIYSTILKLELDSPLEEGRSQSGYAFRSLLDYEFSFDQTATTIITPIPEVQIDIDDTGEPQFDSGN
jgi:hypothetical protein